MGGVCIVRKCLFGEAVRQGALYVFRGVDGRGCAVISSSLEVTRTGRGTVVPLVMYVLPAGT